MKEKPITQRVNTSLGLAWYPKDWWNSRVFREHANNPTLLFSYASVCWYITLEGGEAIITRDIVCQLTNNKKLSRKTWAELQQLFSRRSVVDQSELVNHFWSSPSITKRIKKSINASERVKKTWSGRYQRGNDNTYPRLKVDDNPINRGRADEKPFPPIQKTDEENDLPDWAKD